MSVSSTLAADELDTLDAWWRAANTYLEGTYSELYPHITQDAGGMGRLFKQFSFPAASRRTRRRRRPGRSTRAASWATR
jgi:XFP N-terminal domain